MSNFSLDSIVTGKQERPPRIILLGVEKVGKSTFASQAPNPIFIPIKGEEGIDAMDCAKFPVVSSYDELLQAITTLINNEHPYKTVVLDSSSTLEPLIWQHVCTTANVDSIEKVGGGYGKGYTEAMTCWLRMSQGLDILRDKGITVIMIGHVKTKEIADPLAEPFTAYIWDINQKSASAMQRWADVILFCNQKALISSEDKGFNQKHKRDISRGERALYTHKRHSHPGGGRGVYGQLPYEIDLSWHAWQDAIAAAKNQQ